MMNSTQGISVVLPVYNGMPLLKNSVESVLSQMGVQFELLAGDDQSTDGSFEYLQSIDSSVLQVIRHQKNLGLFGNLNALIRLARYEIIHLWSQDDMMIPGCLKKTLDYHLQNTTIGYAFCKYLIINQHGGEIGRNQISHHKFMEVEGHAITSLVTGSVPGNIANVSVRKSNLEQAGYFKETMKYSCDFDMWCTLSKDRKIGIIQEYLIKLRRHDQQLSRKPEMWIYRLRENAGIFQRYMERVSDRKIKYVKRGMKWRVYTQYFGLLLRLLRCRRFDLARDYYKELSIHSSIIGNMVRYFVMFVARKTGFRAALQNMLYYNNINR
jgi:glycosyltransferase involved in cell wall biosynthesis